MIGYIYSMTNKVNGKMYIGQTIHPKQRRREHRALMGNSFLHKAIKKYNKENFEFEILEKCSAEKMNKREKFWIDYFNTFEGEGYNLTPGGNNFTGEKHPSAKVCIEDCNKILKDRVENKMSFPKIAKKYKLGTTVVSEICKGKHWSKEKVDQNLLEESKKIIRVPLNEKIKKKISDNHADFNGSKHLRLKITVKIAKSIIRDYKKQKYTDEELADKYNLSNTSIGYVLNGEHWTSKFINDFDFRNKKNDSKRSNNPRSKINVKMSRKIIKDREKDGLTYEELSQKYNIARGSIGQIIRNEHWTFEFL